MAVKQWQQTADEWLSANVLGSSDFAAFGFAMLVALGVGGAVVGIWLASRLLRGFLNASGARALRADKSPGYRVISAKVEGSRSARKWLQGALQSHLSQLSFGAPIRLASTGKISGGLAPKSVTKARKRLAAADADMILWSSRLNGRADGLQIYGLSRGGGLRPDEAKPFIVSLPGKKKAREGEMDRVAAYLLAKQLQPAMQHAPSFRPEHLKGLSESLKKMIAGAPGLSEALKDQLEADFCAANVHVAATSGDTGALDEVISLRRIHLKDPAVLGNTEKVTQARMDLGRALLAKAETAYDQKTIQAAIQELSLVVEALRGNPTIQQAQAASDALFKAQTLVENRKRFALNFGS